MWWDESLSHYRATKPVAFILSNKILFPMGDEMGRTTDNHPPLYFLILHVLIRVAGDSEFAMRTLSLACAVLLVPLTYACGVRAYSVAAGLGAAFLAALSPLYLWYAQEIRPYTMVTALGLLSFYALLRIVDPRDPTRSRRRWAWLVLYVTAVLAMVTTHYLSFLLLVAQGVALLLSWPRERAWVSRTIVAVVIVAGGALLWGIQALPASRFLPSFTFLPFTTLVLDVFQQFSFGLYANVLSPLRWVAIALFAGGSLVLTIPRERRVRRQTLYLLLCTALPVIEIFGVSLIRPAYMNVRHLIYASPTYYILIAAGVVRARRLWARVPLSLAYAALAAGMILSTWIYFGDPIAGKAHHREWGRYLADRIRPGDAVIVNPAPIDDLYTYYVESTAPHVGLPVLNDLDKTVDTLRTLSIESDRLWLAHSSTPEWANAHNSTMDWLQENVTRITVAPFESATSSLYVTAYRRTPPFVDAPPPDHHAVGLRFGERLDLVGTRSPQDTIAAGRALQLGLYWAPVIPLEQELRIALALTDDEGFSWAYADYRPAHGIYPPDSWPTDRLVRDDVDLSLPAGTPPGRYRLSVSVYPADGSSGALPARRLADGQLVGLIVPIGEIEIARPETPPRDGELEIAHRAARRYGALAMLGHNYSGGAYLPGDVALLDAYWRAVRAPRRDLTFALQLVDGSGSVVADRMIQPAGSYAPTRWQAGEAVRGQYRFRIPLDTAPGTYTLAIAPLIEEGTLTIWPWQGRRETLHALKVVAPENDRVFARPDMQVTVGANLGDRVELLGYDVTSTDVHPGATLSYTLYWRALQEMQHDYTVFNHLVSADGSTWGQVDHQPQEGTAPTTRWLPGEVVADDYQVDVAADAPAGTLSLHVGLYDQQTMLRLPIYDDAGQVTGDYVPLIDVEVSAP
jgi:hypothetical protein